MSRKVVYQGADGMGGFQIIAPFCEWSKILHHLGLKMVNTHTHITYNSNICIYLPYQQVFSS